ncbi:hypothetical protein PVK06_007529 [Gossypium arboreum]|uniref:Uncharacterized protein n=1 Tax=Gossypium arboreum TaxID=29729 RepID=A0ABR0QID0_GOSAR|nr:hypothetical protein PVK06_007529 [Gossypium arboreum]
MAAEICLSQLPSLVEDRNAEFQLSESVVDIKLYAMHYEIVYACKFGFLEVWMGWMEIEYIVGDQMLQ